MALYELNNSLVDTKTILYLLPLILWSLYWKGWALWRAGNSKDGWWFFALFVLNTAGILPIIYLYIVNPRK